MARQKPEPGLSITRFFTGLVTQRSPLNTPFTYGGLQLIQRNDALISGLNIEISNNYTLQRRGGFPRFCTQQLGGSEYPLSFYSARINGQVVDFVDTNLAVYTFTPTTLTLLFTKSAGAGQTFFQEIGNIVYFANGVDNKKWAPPKTAWSANAVFTLGTLIIDSNGNIQQVTPGPPTTITGATNATPIVITDTAHGYTTGQSVEINSVGGNTAANGTWPITKIDANSYSLNGSAGNGAYTSGGTAQALGGTSGNSQPAWSSTPITGTTTDGQVTWTNRGGQVSNWGITAPASAPTATPTLTGNSDCRFWWPNVTYSSGSYSIFDTNGNVQFADAGSIGKTGSTTPIWATVPQTNTSDNGNSWGCILGPVPWSPSTAFSNISSNGAVIDSNGNLQVVGTGGNTGTSAPTWNASLNGTTTDGSVTWVNKGSAKSLAFQGFQWVFAYHTCYGHVSTASPVTFNTGPIIGKTYGVPLSGQGSPDPQCDYVWIFRIRDGGGSFEFLGQVPNPGNTTWNFTDTVMDANLDDQLLAAQGNLNDPPPAGLTVVSYHMRRMWGGVGNTMQFGIGPDRVIGVAEECWPPANLETFSSNVQKFAPTSQGLCILTNDEWWVEMGGPQTLSFYPQRVLDNFGISSPNCLVQDGEQIFVYTTSRQLWSLSLQQGKEEDGWNVGDILAADFNPAMTYLALHRNGTDVGLFLSDGSSNMLRYSLALNAWGTLYQPVGGVGAIGSIETTVGSYTLMAGRPASSLGGYLLGRSLTSFVDDVNSSYSWNLVMGSIHLSQPGTPPENLASIVVQTTTAGAVPSVAVRLNEIAGPFVNLPVVTDDIFDAPSATINSKRYDLESAQQMLPNQIRHMQLQVAGTAANTKDEILGIHFCPQIEA